MKKSEFLNQFEQYRPRFEEAVELMRTHVRYLLRRRRVMSPAEVEHCVSGRVKSAQSCFNKVRRVERRNRFRITSFAQVQRHIDDIAGIRVVCNYLDELLLVLGYIRRHRAFREIRRKLEDYVQNPKDGYRALHTVVAIQTTSGPARCEVQIRTALEDAWAVKSHSLVYKLKKSDLAALPAEIRSLLVNQSNLIYDIDKQAGDLARLIRRHLRRRGA